MSHIAAVILKPLRRSLVPLRRKVITAQSHPNLVQKNNIKNPINPQLHISHKNSDREKNKTRIETKKMC